MCGIAGIIGEFKREKGHEIAKRMTNTMVHRGPDDEGTWAKDGLAVGMRRLSIIDIEGGHQPMWTQDSVGIILNGEIYNFSELREKLIFEGCGFNTRSDTEVILNLYHRYGIEFINQMEGMFAICIIDNRSESEKVYLIRDRLGIKPLYYGIENGFFYFASEIKAIITGLSAKPFLNKKAIHNYLTLRYVLSPETIWKNIFKIEPACYLAYDIKKHNFNITKYWGVHFNSLKCDCSRDYVKKFEGLFINSVEKHLVTSDVPVGMLLSGGLDSSLVSAAAVELGHKNFHTFNVSFSDGGEFSEASYALQMSKHIGSNHHEIVIGKKEFIDCMDEMVWYSDEPLADLTTIPLYYVTKLASKYVKVVLTGEGSDEIFAGYDIEVLAARLEKLKLISKVTPPFFLRILADVLGGEKSIVLKNLAKDGWSGYLKSRCTHMTNYWSEDEKKALWKEPFDTTPTNSLIHSWYDDAISKNPIDQLQEVYLRSWLVEDLLMKADKMSMANSLELRVPFLHHPIVEWAANLPLEWKVGGQKTGYVSKRILREFACNRIPEAIINRPKKGFPVPAYEWLKGCVGDWAKECILYKSRFIGSLFDLSVVDSLLSRAREGDSYSAHKIWILIILEYWGRKWA